MKNRPSKKELFELAKAFIPKNIPAKYEIKGVITYTIGIEGFEYRVTYLLNNHYTTWYVSDITNADGTPLPDT